MPYGRLSITVVGDTRPLENAVRQAAQSAGDDAAKTIGTAMQRSLRGVGTVLSSVGKAAATGLTGATAAATAFGVASFRTAARVGEMDASLQALAKANGLSYAAMQKHVKEIRTQGIEAGTAQTVVARFAQNQLDLAKSTDLAKVAQDAAVISGKNSTEVLDQLIHGVTTQNSLVLRNAGINVQAGKAMDAYAASIGKSAKDLTEAERAQAVLNAVLQDGSKIAGAYASAMEEPGKVLRSFPRLFDDIKLSVGQGLVQAFGPAILQTYKLTKALSESLMEGGKLRPIIDAIGQAVQRLTKFLAPMIEGWTKWLKTVDPGQITKITDAIKKFGPAVMIGAGAVSALTAPQLLSRVPVLGDVLKNLGGPANLAKGALLNVGKAAAGTLPGLRDMVPGARQAAGALGGMAGPLALAAAGFALLMAVSPEFRSAMMELARVLLDALRPVLDAIVTSVKVLIPVFVQMAQVAGGVLATVIRSALVPALQVVARVLQVLQPILPGLVYAWLAYAAATKVVAAVQAALQFARWVGFLIQYVTQIHLAAVAQGVAAVASKVWAAAQWLLNAALTANPIGIIIVAIVALVAGLVLAYQKVGWFRDAVDWLGRIIRAALGGVTLAAMRAFSGWWADQGDQVIKICQGIGAAFRWLGGVISSYLSGVVDNFRQFAAVLAPIWTVLWTLIRFVATSYFNYVVMQLRIAWAIITGIFQVGMAVLRGIWDLGFEFMRAIAQVVTAAIIAIFKIWWNLIVGIFTVGLNLLTGNWRGAWDAMRQYGQQICNALLQFFRSWWSAQQGLWTGGTNALKNTWSTSWDAMRSTAVSVGNAIRDFMAALWRQINQAAGTAWTGIVNTIKTAWERLKETVRAPVAWVVNNVINKLINGINTLITKIGITKIEPIAGFASGGKIPGRGRGDHVPILAEPGEWMLTRRQAQAIGYANLRHLPRYQAGGPVVGPDGGLPPPLMRIPGLDQLKTWGAAFARMTHLDDLASAGKDLFDSFTGMLTYAAAEAFRLLTAPLKKIVEPWAEPGTVPMFPKQWIGKLTLQAIDKAVEFIAGKALGPCGSLAGGDVGGIVASALRFNGRPYRWGGGANPQTGFDCSSFVSYIAGSAGLPLPGGFRVPSMAHGPVTTDYLGWGGMTSVPLGSAPPGAVAVSPSHIGFIIGPGGSGFAARSTATGIGPQNFARGYTYRVWNGGQGPSGAGDGATTGICDPGAGQSGFGYSGNVESWRGLVTQIATQLGIPWTVNAWMAQIRTESGGNANAIQQVRDVNWPNNRAQGLLQVIPPTFAAYGPPGGNPFNPAHNIYAAMRYAIARYGAGRITSVIGQGRGYALGGVVSEPVIGIGLRSGVPYSFAEQGPELVSPLAGPGYTGSWEARQRVTINVYPQPGQDERQIAAAVSRELAWAYAGGVS